MTKPPKPTKEELAAAWGKKIPDIIAPDLQVLFCGINPGLYSGATGFHFARPGNRFWSALHGSGFTPQRLYPHQEDVLLELGYGITNLVDRATTAADELTPSELVEGGKNLIVKAERFSPLVIAILGITAYRTAFGKPKAKLGLQDELIGQSKVWVLPNPSGLNAHYTPTQLADVFCEFRLEVEKMYG